MSRSRPARLEARHLEVINLRQNNLEWRHSTRGDPIDMPDLLAWLLLGTVAFVAPLAAQETGRGLLSRDAGLLGERALDPAELDALAAADPPGARRYLERRRAFQSEFGPDPGDRAARGPHANRVIVQRAIVSLIDRPGIEATAADVAKALAVSVRRERNAAGIARETASAEAYLRSHSDTPAAPYLYAFLASRYRMAFESTADRGEKERLARKYRTMLDRLRAQPDPIFRTLARDLDELDSVLGEHAEHPREYLPPG